MPDYIRLKTDKDGWPIQPKGWVTTLVQHRDAWHTVLGPLDAVTHRHSGHRGRQAADAQALISHEGLLAIQSPVVGDQR